MHIPLLHAIPVLLRVLGAVNFLLKLPKYAKVAWKISRFLLANLGGGNERLDGEQIEQLGIGVDLIEPLTGDVLERIKEARERGLNNRQVVRQILSLLWALNADILQQLWESVLSREQQPKKQK